MCVCVCRVSESLRVCEGMRGLEALTLESQQRTTWIQSVDLLQYDLYSVHVLP